MNKIIAFKESLMFFVFESVFSKILIKFWFFKVSLNFGSPMA